MRVGRKIGDTFNLVTHGFEFVDHKTKMANFYDEIEIQSVYYRELRNS